MNWKKQSGHTSVKGVGQFKIIPAFGAYLKRHSYCFLPKVKTEASFQCIQPLLRGSWQFEIKVLHQIDNFSPYVRQPMEWGSIRQFHSLDFDCTTHTGCFKAIDCFVNQAIIVLSGVVRSPTALLLVSTNNCCLPLVSMIWCSFNFWLTFESRLPQTTKRLNTSLDGSLVRRVSSSGSACCEDPVPMSTQEQKQKCSQTLGTMGRGT